MRPHRRSTGEFELLVRDSEELGFRGEMDVRECLEMGSRPVAQGLAPELCSDAQASLPTTSRVVSATTASGTSTTPTNRANRAVRVQQAASRSALLNRDQTLDEMERPRLGIEAIVRKRARQGSQHCLRAAGLGTRLVADRDSFVSSVH